MKLLLLKGVQGIVIRIAASPRLHQRRPLVSPPRFANVTRFPLGCFSENASSVPLATAPLLPSIHVLQMPPPPFYPRAASATRVFADCPLLICLPSVVAPEMPPSIDALPEPVHLPVGAIIRNAMHPLSPSSTLPSPWTVSHRIADTSLRSRYVQKSVPHIFVYGRLTRLPSRLSSLDAAAARGRPRGGWGVRPSGSGVGTRCAAEPRNRAPPGEEAPRIAGGWKGA